MITNTSSHMPHLVIKSAGTAKTRLNFLKKIQHINPRFNFAESHQILYNFMKFTVVTREL